MNLDVGLKFEIVHAFSPEDVAAFARITGDLNPIHVDAAFAATTRFGRPIVHGILVVGLFARVLGHGLPGLAVVYVAQEVRFLAPSFVGDPIRVALEVIEVLDKGRVRVKTTASRVDGTVCVEGIATIIAPRG